MLTIKCLGPFSAVLTDGDNPHTIVPSKNAKWLLGLLSAHHGHPISREWLSDRLCPETDDPGKWLRQTLWEVRSIVQLPDVILSDGNQALRLNLSSTDVDVITFDQAIHRGDGASLRDAINQYNGLYMEGCNDAWALLEQDKRHGAALRAIDILAIERASEGDFAEELRYRRRAAALAPQDESVLRSLLCSLERNQDISGVEAAYKAFTKRLNKEHARVVRNKELPPTPSTGTQSVYRAILERNERDRNVPCLFNARLPVPVSEIIGRSEAVFEALKLLSARRLVTLTGMGGIGKTRLAIEVAALKSPAFRDGAGFVDLSAIHDPSLISMTLASSLGIQVEIAKDTDDVVLMSLRYAKLLLVLDNCEHLIDATAQFAFQILSSCEHIRILATSREPLDVTGEAVYVVPPLGQPEENECDPHIILQTHAAQLFVDRAKAADSRFDLTKELAGAVASICRTLDGIPLSLELAAALVLTTSPTAIAQGIGSRYKLLSKGARSAPDRHRSLSAVIDWSYRLLPDAQKQLFNSLSVFAGGWTISAVEDICAGKEFAPRVGANGTNCFIPALIGNDIILEEVASMLLGLVSRSMIVYDKENDRYRFLETVREYAIAQLAKDRNLLAVLRARHAYYYHELACEASIVNRAHRYIRDKANYRAALEWSVTDPEVIGWGLTFIAALSAVWLNSGDLSEGLGWARRILSHPHAMDFDEYVLGAHCGAVSAVMQRDLETASLWFTESVKAGEAVLRCGSRVGSRVGMDQIKVLASTSIAHMGDIALSNSDHDSAILILEDVLRREKSIASEQTREPVWSLRTEACLLRLKGDIELAQLKMQEALSIIEAAGEEQEALVTRNYLAGIACDREDWATASFNARCVLHTRMSQGYSGDIEVAMLVLARVSQGIGDFERAAIQLGAVLRMFEDKSTKPFPLEQTQIENLRKKLLQSFSCEKLEELLEIGLKMAWRIAAEFALGMCCCIASEQVAAYN